MSEKYGIWIPASERLPEEGIDVLVWFEYFRFGEYNRLFQTMGISSIYNGEWSGFVNGESGWRQLRIIAWMPLPEPYKSQLELLEEARSKMIEKAEISGGKRMLEYTIHFTDGGVLTVKGTIDNKNNSFLLYGEDQIIKYIIPASQIKYIEVN